MGNLILSPDYWYGGFLFSLSRKFHFDKWVATNMTEGYMKRCEQCNAPIWMQERDDGTYIPLDFSVAGEPMKAHDCIGR